MIPLFSSQRLVRIDRPVCRVPTLAIHLETAKEREAFKVNKEDHLSPILTTSVAKSLTSDGDAPADWEAHQEPVLLKMLASELDVDVAAIADFELSLFDTHMAAFGGAFEEFLYSSRIDNLASCFMATETIAEHDLAEEEDVLVVALFDHEEVGSTSQTGAGSPMMGEAVRRLSSALRADGEGEGGEDLYAAAVRRSFVLSVDMAHAIHPNYASKHERAHAPKMNAGPVIKSNASQRYATNGETGT
mmetsp:Transcript_17254/g.38903  ORF Transcript_17254/g.38903 Transcript_17254/m.38903 type:complete len:246 (-) Transcript_17254:715-1452(-)